MSTRQSDYTWSIYKTGVRQSHITYMNIHLYRFNLNQCCRCIHTHSITIKTKLQSQINVVSSILTYQTKWDVLCKCTILYIKHLCVVGFVQDICTYMIWCLKQGRYCSIRNYLFETYFQTGIDTCVCQSLHYTMNSQMSFIPNVEIYQNKLCIHISLLRHKQD